MKRIYIFLAMLLIAAACSGPYKAKKPGKQTMTRSQVMKAQTGNYLPFYHKKH